MYRVDVRVIGAAVFPIHSSNLFASESRDGCMHVFRMKRKYDQYLSTLERADVLRNPLMNKLHRITKGGSVV